MREGVEGGFVGFLEKRILCISITLTSDAIVGASSIRLTIILGPFSSLANIFPSTSCLCCGE